MIKQNSSLKVTKGVLSILIFSSLLLFTACGGSSGSSSTSGSASLTGGDSTTPPTNQNHGPTIDTKSFNDSITGVPNIFQSGDKWKGLEYKTIVSPYTGKIWLDRNLGASMVCNQSRDDFASDADYVRNQKDCFGDYYQWGRIADGHEKYSSDRNDTQATSTSNVGHGKFIYGSNDWANTDSDGSKRSSNWLKTNGDSVCPRGYKVPTMNELAAETTGLSVPNKVKNRADAFNNFLKLPSAGIRYLDGSLSFQGFSGRVWSSSVGMSDDSSKILLFDISNAYWSDYYRADGLSVRCIKD
ncbi:hypothetical protein MNB_ARC-1_977 [hydrothermal vent metagenome]|uniref:Uncharacterized protein n=1 Tax=hydrothermal vent metagenome TaxID=652676 RepID=A0A3B1DUD8_9ZZZZ